MYGINPKCRFPMLCAMIGSGLAGLLCGLNGVIANGRRGRPAGIRFIPSRRATGGRCTAWRWLVASRYPGDLIHFIYQRKHRQEVHYKLSNTSGAVVSQTHFAGNNNDYSLWWQKRRYLIRDPPESFQTRPAAAPAITRRQCAAPDSSTATGVDAIWLTPFISRRRWITVMTSQIYGYRPGPTAHASWMIFDELVAQAQHAVFVSSRIWCLTILLNSARLGFAKR